MTKSEIAKKAVATRKARNEFARLYGSEVAMILNCIVYGWSNQEIMDEFSVSKGRVLAIRAHKTRNSYAPYITNDGSGSCNMKKQRRIK